MYGSIVKRILSVTDSEEACTLLKGLLSQLRYFQKLLAVSELSVLLTVSNYILCNC